MKALFLSADQFEDMELMVPYYRLKEAGMQVDIASPKPGSIKGIHDYKVAVDKKLEDVNPDEYAILVIPGGRAPQEVRKIGKALEIARNFVESNKPVIAICHGPQVLISAGLMNGRHATSYSAVARELKDAGAIFEDRDVVIDSNIITSRGPPDLPSLMREIMKVIHL